MSIIFYQLPLSHYCEKVRWALNYKNIIFEKINLIPGRKVRKIRHIFRESSVPLLNDNGHFFQGSSEIIDYLDRQYPQRLLTPEEPSLAEQTRDWEQRLDNIAGPSVCRFMYYYFLHKPSVVIPLLAAKQPFFIRWLFSAGYSKLESKIRESMNINEVSVHEAIDKMDKLLTELRDIYANSRYLVGDTFTRADLTACALFAPLYQPSGYGLKWPSIEEAPKEMTCWLSKHERALQSLALRYEQNR